MMKLRKFKEKKLTNKNIMISFGIMVLFMIMIVISKSYAIYKLEKKYDLIQSKIGSFTNGDIKIAVLVDGKETNEFPSYETNYKIESVECTNGVTGSFDVENWQVTIADMKATSTKCTVSFDSSATNEITPVNMSKTELIALNEEITNMATTTILDKVYPVGSIYMSTTDDTIEKVQNKFGGTWVKYAEDMTLVGASSSKAVNTTGGSSTVTLTTDNLPSHSHVIPALSVSSWSGSHKHSVNDQYLNQYVSNLNGWNNANIGDAGTLSGYGIARTIANKGEEHLGIPSFDTNDTVLTVSGQKTTTSSTTSCTNCSANSFNIQNPYISVYMYKRTA